MLLELAIGDAYGAGFEYTSKHVPERNNLSAYLRHPRHNTQPGQYTDDTQMSLAIAEAIVSEDTWTPLYLVRRFVEVFHRDLREGYASRFYAFLQQTQTGEEFLAHIQPLSDKSGAAMRASPIGNNCAGGCQLQPRSHSRFTTAFSGWARKRNIRTGLSL